ncbi:PfkB family carbohydrate kinase [Halomarina ordinaria]|uniref:PfkB family carbohydrate kinase n=1 Tax=Halomarina ordinaria TaxID=3033939 RepID=A0ABD5UFM7_9EURY|nr:PfkB family carbohydrate kinase [Halomarina sp. PSRA2]
MDSPSRAVYEALPDALDANSPVRVTALPDGSVDTFGPVHVGAGTVVEDRTDFAGRVEAGASKSFRLVPRRREPGGQATNMALQAHALSDDVTLYGYLDDPLFADLPFETVSMGTPARVSVCEFVEGDVVLAEASGDVSAWDLAALDDVADLEAALGADAVCCGNWVSIPGMTDALRALGDHLLADVFVFDPGDLTGTDPSFLADFLDALAVVGDGWSRVVLSVNRREADALASAGGVGTDATGVDFAARLAGLRERTGISGVVCHDEAAATAATPDDVVHVANLETEDVTRQTGGGDRFDAGLAHGLAVGWGWRSALGLANTCASYYVERGETVTREDVRPYLAGYV